LPVTFAAAALGPLRTRFLTARDPEDAARIQRDIDILEQCLDHSTADPSKAHEFKTAALRAAGCDHLEDLVNRFYSEEEQGQLTDAQKQWVESMASDLGAKIKQQWAQSKKVQKQSLTQKLQKETQAQEEANKTLQEAREKPKSPGKKQLVQSLETAFQEAKSKATSTRETLAAFDRDDGTISPSDKRVKETLLKEINLFREPHVWFSSLGYYMALAFAVCVRGLHLTNMMGATAGGQCKQAGEARALTHPLCGVLLFSCLQSTFSSSMG
jgi:hypothetical protein